jgi:hypothetical protein
MTNREFAEQDERFRKDCTKSQTAPTPRQASKYRNKKGKAFRAAQIRWTKVQDW